MIVNPISIEDKYKCKKPVMEYLVYRCKLPILSFDKDFYYFSNTDALRKSLKAMPALLKASTLFTK